MSIDEMKTIIQNVKSRTEFAEKLGYSYYNGKIGKIINDIIEQNKFDITHFIPNGHESKYSKIEKICPTCKLKFETDSGGKGETTFCCNSCASKARTLSIESREKISKSLTGRVHSKQLFIKYCLYCNNKFETASKKKQFCSNRCSGKYKWTQPQYRNHLTSIMNEKVKNGTHSGWKSRSKITPSYPEQYFMEVLNNLGVHYTRELNVGKYFIDFAIEDKKIALEIDGKQHLMQERIESDKLKDELLKSEGWKVIRIHWHNPINDKNKEKLYNQIDEFKQVLTKKGVI